MVSDVKPGEYYAAYAIISMLKVTMRKKNLLLKLNCGSLGGLSCACHRGGNSSGVCIAICLSIKTSTRPINRKYQSDYIMLM